jgi:hypothetical protein
MSIPKPSGKQITLTEFNKRFSNKPRIKRLMESLMEHGEAPFTGYEVIDKYDNYGRKMFESLIALGYVKAYHRWNLNSNMPQRVRNYFDMTNQNTVYVNLVKGD